MSSPGTERTRRSAIFRPASATPANSGRPGSGCAPGCASRSRSRRCAVWSLHLDGYRESRKAVIAVTQGWRLFTANQTRMTDEGTQDPRRAADRRRPGRQARYSRSRTLPRDRSPGLPDPPRWRVSMTDSRLMFRELIGEANRASTSFYTVDASGLRAEGRPIAATPLRAGGRVAQPRAHALHDHVARFARSVARPMGWRSSTATTSGPGCSASPTTSTPTTCSATPRRTARPTASTRKIKVAVKRPGVQVRAREGYLARRVDVAAGVEHVGAPRMPPRTLRPRSSPRRWADWRRRGRACRW